MEATSYSVPPGASSKGSNTTAFKWAAIVTLVSIVLSLVSYRFILTNYYVFSGAYLVIGLVSIVLYFLAGLERRKVLGGFISFKEAFRTIFIVILLSSVVVTVWDVLYTTVIDKQLPQKMVEGSIAFMESIKAPQSEIDKVVDRMNKQQQEGFTIGSTLLALASSVVIKSIFGMICAAILKREPQARMQ